MERHPWNEDEFFFDLLPHPTHGQEWWPGIDEVKKKSDVAVLRITGKPTRWHEVVKVHAELSEIEKEKKKSNE